jgi:PAS domain S-box-containing protein
MEGQVMKTKTKVVLLILIPVVLSLVTVTGLIWMQKEIKRAEQVGRLTDEIVHKVFELDQVVSQNLLYPEERPRVQFRSINDSLKNTLARFPAETAPEGLSIRKMIGNQADIAFLFPLISGGEGKQAADLGDRFYQEYKGQVTSQLLIKLKEIVSDGFQLMKSSGDRINGNVQRVNRVMITVILIGGLAMMLLAGFIGQALLQNTKDLQREIDDRRQAEEDLRTSEERLRENEATLRGVLDAVKESIWLFSLEGVVLTGNSTAFSRFPLPPAEVIGRSVTEIMPAELAESRLAQLGEVVESAQAREFEDQRAGILFQHNFYPVLDEQGQVRAVVSFSRDITEIRRAEESLRQSREDLDRAQAVGQIGSWRLDVRRNALTWSDENHRIFGVPQGTPLTYETFLGTIHPDDRQYVDTRWQAGLRGAPYDIEHRIVADGQEKWVREKAYLEFDETGELRGGFGITQDVTERKRSEQELREREERLRASLGEKEVLLKEIHHRVKNNMQVISSLVSLQAEELQDAVPRAIFQDLTHRVRSMALVHEKLYQSVDLARVEFAEYLRSLLSYLWRAYGTEASGVRLTVDVEPVMLSVNTAVPFGLILNELVGNALKHAFRDRAEGEVIVSFRGGAPGRVRLSVRDNGTGLPAGVDWRQARSLGLRLVQMLAGQLRAAVEVSSAGGTEFTITLEEPKT